jgi:hypothetical protein
MRSALIAISAFCIGTTIVGCSKNNSNQDSSGGSGAGRPTVNTNRGATGGEVASWTLKLSSKCPDSVSATNCVGYYGFSVDELGHYQVGPGPTGEVRTGALKPEDMTALNSLLHNTIGEGNDQSSGLSLLGSEEHVSLDSATASEDLVTLSNTSTQGQKLLRTSGLDLYFTLKSADEAKALYAGVRKLAEVYYAPIPFPDTCEDGINALQGVVATVTSCKQDSDCGYFDSTLNLVAPDAQAFLEADNCARVLPISVANVEAIKTSKAKIQESWSQLIQACGERLMRTDCTQRTGFNLNRVAAVCQQGVCKAPSSLVLTTGTPASFR